VGNSFYEIDSAKSAALVHHFVRAAPVKQAARLTGQDGGLSRLWPKVEARALSTATYPPAFGCRVLFNPATNFSIS